MITTDEDGGTYLVELVERLANDPDCLADILFADDERRGESNTTGSDQLTLGTLTERATSEPERARGGHTC